MCDACVVCCVFCVSYVLSMYCASCVLWGFVCCVLFNCVVGIVRCELALLVLCVLCALCVLRVLRALSVLGIFVL